MIEPRHEDDEPTPTVRELWARKDGSVEAVDFNKDGEPTRFRLLPKGHELLNGIMRRNAERALARGAGALVRDARQAVRERAVPTREEAAKEKGKSRGRKSTFTEA